MLTSAVDVTITTTCCSTTTATTAAYKDALLHTHASVLPPNVQRSLHLLLLLSSRTCSWPLLEFGYREDYHDVWASSYLSRLFGIPYDPGSPMNEPGLSVSRVCFCVIKANNPCGLRITCHTRIIRVDVDAQCRLCASVNYHRPGGDSGHPRGWYYRSVSWVRAPPSAYSYKFGGTFSCT